MDGPAGGRCTSAVVAEGDVLNGVQGLIAAFEAEVWHPQGRCAAADDYEASVQAETCTRRDQGGLRNTGLNVQAETKSLAWGRLTSINIKATQPS